MNSQYFTGFSSPEQKAQTNFSYQIVCRCIETVHILIFSIGPISIESFLREECLSLFK